MRIVLLGASAFVAVDARIWKYFNNMWAGNDYRKRVEDTYNKTSESATETAKDQVSTAEALEAGMIFDKLKKDNLIWRSMATTLKRSNHEGLEKNLENAIICGCSGAAEWLKELKSQKSQPPVMHSPVSIQIPIFMKEAIITFDKLKSNRLGGKRKDVLEKCMKSSNISKEQLKQILNFRNCAPEWFTALKKAYVNRD